MNEQNKKLISISIVIYKTNIDILKETIDALVSSCNALNYKIENISEIYLINNCSEKKYKILYEKFIAPYIKEHKNISFNIINNVGNVGFGKGHNKIINKINSCYHLCLNPDVTLNIDALGNAIKFLSSNEEVGLLSPSVFGEDGERQYVYKKYPTLFDQFLRRFAFGFIKKIFQGRMHEYELRDLNYTKIQYNLPCLTGCFMFFRTDIFTRLNGFDKRFFLYMEDADISRRALDITNTVYHPDVLIRHKWMRGSHNKLLLTIYNIISSFKYWWKWGGIY